MTGWLSFLPHQIPFRAISRIVVDESGRASGLFHISAADPLFEGAVASDLMIFEAMAQLGGAVVFGRHGAPALLTSIQDASVDGQLSVGDTVALEVELEAGFGSVHRLRARGLRDGLEIARARLYLAAGPTNEDQG